MTRTHPIRHACRWVLQSDLSEERERARDMSIRKSTTFIARSNSGRWWKKPVFDWFILFCIIASTVILAIDTPPYRITHPNSNNLFRASDFFFAIVFIGAG